MLTRMRLLSVFTGIVTVVLVVAGGFLLVGSILSAEGPTIDGEVKLGWQPGRQRATPVPVPDAAQAKPVAAARPELLAIPGVAPVVRALSTGDVDAIMSLFDTERVQCSGRASENCARVAGSIEGYYDAVIVEDSGVRFYSDPARVRALIELLIANGTLELELVTRDQAATGMLGRYYMTFRGASVDGTEATPSLFPTIMNGIGLKVDAGAAHPIVEFSALSESWGPLEWIQFHGAEGQVLVTPESVEGFVRIDD